MIFVLQCWHTIDLVRSTYMLIPDSILIEYWFPRVIISLFTGRSLSIEYHCELTLINTCTVSS